MRIANLQTRVHTPSYRQKKAPSKEEKRKRLLTAIFMECGHSKENAQACANRSITKSRVSLLTSRRSEPMDISNDGSPRKKGPRPMDTDPDSGPCAEGPQPMDIDQEAIDETPPFTSHSQPLQGLTDCTIPRLLFSPLFDQIVTISPNLQAPLIPVDSFTVNIPIQEKLVPVPDLGAMQRAKQEICAKSPKLYTPLHPLCLFPCLRSKLQVSMREIQSPARKELVNPKQLRHLNLLMLCPQGSFSHNKRLRAS